MKKVFILCVFVFCVFCSNGQKINVVPMVDERTELMSIVCRLAEFQEYSGSDLLFYASQVDSVFSFYKSHALVSFLQQMRAKYGIAYDAIMSMAIHLKIENNHISLLENVIDNDIDQRWYQDSIPKFLTLLNDFYIQSHFYSFYEQWKPYHAVAAENFNKILKDVDFQWFEKYYGEILQGEFKLIISLSNGGSNYGPSLHFKDGKEEIYAIIGTWATDSADNPVYSPRVTDLIIHEFNHSFCNPLVYMHKQELLPKAEEAYRLNRSKFDQQAYGSGVTVMCEMLVRVSVIKYFQAHQLSENRIKYLLEREKSLGFIWIDTLFGALTQYEQDRTMFPTLRSFMPEIIKRQSDLNLKKMQKEQDKKRPVISVSNI